MFKGRIYKKKGRTKAISYKITDRGCYEVINKNPNRKGIGYFNISRFGRQWILSRLIFYIYNGYLTETVMHSCDNPMCINPAHLIGGTPKENSQDATKKGRIAFGTRNKGGGNKLDDEKVKQIKTKLAEGLSLMTLAKQFNVSKKMILYIKQGRKWKHVKI